MRKLTTLLLWPIAAGILVAFVMLTFFPQGISPSLAPVEIHQVSPTPPTSNLGVGPVSYADAVAKAAPAVVNIYTRSRAPQNSGDQFEDPALREYYGQPDANGRTQRQVISSLGSGVIISPQGYIVTNNHVITDAESILVALHDGREAEAKVIGTDPETDLAVLKIELKELAVIDLAVSQPQQVGDVVLAIGNPFGVGQTVTMGIISATGRNQLGINTYENFIQTDAAINPGNSGGALVNAMGNMIGINTAIFSRSGGSQGIGFAIPVDLVRSVLKGIIENGRVVRGWLGIEIQQMTPALAESFGTEEAWGLIIAGIFRDSPAHQAGMQPGDVLISIDGQPIRSGQAAMNQIAVTKPGTMLKLGLLRNGELINVEATIGNRPPTRAR
ncbi:S1C family serine protease [Motiliproteus sp.]|uniref:S1C family serine protease n=1 Tax=Motiliproteus sp. TaxID=1898955 RepID=UPI003BADB887